MPQGAMEGFVYPVAVAAFLGIGAWMLSMLRLVRGNNATVKRIEFQLFDREVGALPKIRGDIATNALDLRAHRDDDAQSFRDVHARIDSYMNGSGHPMRPN